MDAFIVLLGILAAILVTGSMVYCILTGYAAVGYIRVNRREADTFPPVTVMKPLSGLDEGLEDNLRSYFSQDYPEYEILLAIRYAGDPAAGVARKVMAEFPSVPARLIVVGESPIPNAKVFSLERMFDEAENDIIVMTDSDTRVHDNFLRVIAGEMEDERIGLVTCPYKAVPGNSFWSRLEAIGLNTEFLSGVLVARMLMGMDFALGPAIATRRSLVDKIGGFGRLQNYLAEDFVLGNLMAASGNRVLLSSYRIEHRIGSQGFIPNIEHRLRWARSTRRSRPAGYIGQLFTNPLPLVLMLLAVDPMLYPLAVSAFLLRLIAGWILADRVLGAPLTFSDWLLLPLQDIISFAVWVGGFFGSTVTWRGKRYNVHADGTLGTVES